MLIFDFPDHAAPGTTHDRLPRRLTFDHPIEILQAHDAADVRGVLRAVEAATRRGLYAAGFVSYEAAPAFDAAHEVRAGGTLPLAWFGLYHAPTQEDAPAPTGDAEPKPGRDPELDSTLDPVLALEPQITLPALGPDVDRATYDDAVAHIREAIARGDVYQVNYTFPLRGGLSAAETSADAARALYERIARGGHGGYSACLDIGTHRLLSFSPELFFERIGDRVVCRPMKGTAARGRWAEEDDARARWLARSEKNRAENVMIVDLVRNDLGRVARVGGVRVSSLCAIERYPTVWQMTSTVEADLRPGTTLDELFGAVFPCGSITGAPKISAMRQIAALESSPRGVYCGAIGIAAPDRALFNVAIRTLTIDAARRTADYRVGGGVTWDSHSPEEYAEARAKAALLQPRPTFSLLETMRLQDGVIVRLERHLARLLSSAHYFEVPTDVEPVRARLQKEANAHPHGSWRVRLLLSPTGDPTITVSACDPPRSSDAPRIVALAATPVDPEDPFLCHKTTHRSAYDTRRAEHPDLFDVLLWNTRGELTEFTIGNVVLDLDGARVTPPRASGLLDGTFRNELIDAGTIAERVLTLDDVRRADAIWLINSVREWVRVTFDARSSRLYP